MRSKEEIFKELDRISRIVTINGDSVEAQENHLIRNREKYLKPFQELKEIKDILEVREEVREPKKEFEENE